MRDVKALADGVINSVRAMVAAAVGSLSNRIDALTARVDAMPSSLRGEDGKDADPELMRAEVQKEFSAMAESFIGGLRE